MSLVRLLTSGKSLIGLDNVANRYRMRSKNPLPKFGSAQNPFSTARPEPLKTSTEKIPTVTRTLVSAEVAAGKLNDTAPLPLIREIPAPADAAPRQERTGRQEGWLRRWLRAANPFSWWNRRRTAERRPALPRFNKAPVQAELSLDKVKVVRNDLSDADVEVVTATMAAPLPAEPVPEPARVDDTPELIKL